MGIYCSIGTYLNEYISMGEYTFQVVWSTRIFKYFFYLFIYLFKKKYFGGENYPKLSQTS